MVIWLIGLSGSGKTFIGRALYERLKTRHANTVYLDGDLIREIMGNDLGHSLEDRKKNADRICRLCQLLDQQGIHVVCAILSLFPESRIWNRKNFKNYFEIFIETSLDVLKQRDSKGLYAKALRGEIKNVVGIDMPFPPPENPDLVIKNERHLESPESLVNLILEKMSALK